MTARSSPPLRGQVFFADLGKVGRKPVLVVSNNIRNRRLGDVIVARITTASKPDIPSIVQLPNGEPVVGRVLCDDLSTVSRDILTRSAGGLSQRSMRAVDDGLRVALGLSTS